MLNFIGIGAQKAGTTWLYERLSAHPGLCFPAGKEIHFWNRDRNLGIDWYRARFPVDAAGRRQGEITPAYAILPSERIAEIRAIFPDVRLIYIIRNPIERAWSSARMALERAEMTLDEASDQWFIDHFHSRGSLARGDYLACLQNWHRHFPVEQLLVLRYERLRADPAGLLNDCLEHLGLPPFGTADDGHSLPEGFEQRVFPSLAGTLRASLLPPLQTLYAQRIDALADYLGWDLDAWTTPSEHGIDVSIGGPSDQN